MLFINVCNLPILNAKTLRRKGAKMEKTLRLCDFASWRSNFKTLKADEAVECFGIMRTFIVYFRACAISLAREGGASASKHETQ